MASHKNDAASLFSVVDSVLIVFLLLKNFGVLSILLQTTTMEREVNS